MDNTQRLARLRELTGPEAELALHPEQLDYLCELFRELDGSLSQRDGTLPQQWAGGEYVGWAYPHGGRITPTRESVQQSPITARWVR